VSGVGPLTALAYVLTIEDPKRFQKSREVGPCLGLFPIWLIRRSKPQAIDAKLSFSDYVVMAYDVQSTELGFIIWTIDFSHDAYVFQDDLADFNEIYASACV
jgi:hypothetical protein